MQCRASCRQALAGYRPRPAARPRRTAALPAAADDRRAGRLLLVFMLVGLAHFLLVFLVKRRAAGCADRSGRRRFPGAVGSCRSAPAPGWRRRSLRWPNGAPARRRRPAGRKLISVRHSGTWPTHARQALQRVVHANRARPARCAAPTLVALRARRHRRLQQLVEAQCRRPGRVDPRQALRRAARGTRRGPSCGRAKSCDRRPAASLRGVADDGPAPPPVLGARARPGPAAGAAARRDLR